MELVKRFKVLMLVKIQADIFWVVTACSVVVEYQCYVGILL